MTFCILRRSDIKNVMTFLIAEPLVPRAIHQHAVPGDLTWRSTNRDGRKPEV